MPVNRSLHATRHTISAWGAISRGGGGGGKALLDSGEGGDDGLMVEVRGMGVLRDCIGVPEGVVGLIYHYVRHHPLQWNQTLVHPQARVEFDDVHTVKCSEGFTWLLTAESSGLQCCDGGSNSWRR